MTLPWRIAGAVITILFWVAITGLTAFIATRDFDERNIPVLGEKLLAKDATPEQIKYLLAIYGVKYPDWVFVQSVHETDNFTSNVFLDCNNPFGMKLSRRKNASRWCRGHAQFRSLNMAIKDFKEYQDLYMIPYEEKYGEFEDIGDYLDFLKSANYAEDPEYKGSVLKLFHQHQK